MRCKDHRRDSAYDLEEEAGRAIMQDLMAGGLGGSVHVRDDFV